MESWDLPLVTVTVTAVATPNVRYNCVSTEGMHSRCQNLWRGVAWLRALVFERERLPSILFYYLDNCHFAGEKQRNAFNGGGVVRC